MTTQQGTPHHTQPAVGALNPGCEEELRDGFAQFVALLHVYWVNAEPAQGFHDPRAGFVVRELYEALVNVDPCDAEVVLYGVNIPDRVVDYCVGVLVAERASGDNLSVYSADAAQQALGFVRRRQVGEFVGFLRRLAAL